MRTGRRRGIVVWAAAVLLVCIAAAWMARQRPLEVRTAEVRRAPLVVHVVTNGKVEPAGESEVRARLDGRIVEIAEDGAAVDAGQVVLRIDDTAVASALAQARADRVAAREELRRARAAFERAREEARVDEELFRSGAITAEARRLSQVALEEAKSRLAFLSREVPLRIDALDLKIKELSEQRRAAAVKTPHAGTVYRRAAKKGQVVHAGDPVLWIADLEHLRVRANIDQVDLGRVQVGQKVVIRSNAFPETPVSGKVEEVLPNVVHKESRAVSEALIAVSGRTDGLVPGMTVDVEVIVEEIPDAIQIPLDAVFVEGAKNLAYRVDGRRLVRSEIETGAANALFVEVKSGLDEGDTVVVFPRTGLHDGMRVAVR